MTSGPTIKTVPSLTITFPQEVTKFILEIKMKHGIYTQDGTIWAMIVIFRQMEMDKRALANQDTFEIS